MAKQVLGELQVNIDLAEAFAPGLRRYIIAPLTASEGQTNDTQKVRIQRAIQRVRNSNVTLYQADADTPSRLWMAISQPPDRRKRAQLAAKTKRVILEQREGALDRIEASFSRVHSLAGRGESFGDQRPQAIPGGGRGTRLDLPAQDSRTPQDRRGDHLPRCYIDYAAARSFTECKKSRDNSMARPREFTRGDLECWRALAV